MHVVILGGSGFIGTALTRLLIQRGDTVTIPTRSPGKGQTNPLGQTDQGIQGRLEYTLWNGRSSDELASIVAGGTAVVNLLGENIAAKRWTPQQKELLVNSRVQAGTALLNAFQSLPHRTQLRGPHTLIQASATGYYGLWPRLSEAPPCIEASPAGQGFLAHTAVRWESSTLEAEQLGIRRCVIRTAPVLGPGGGLLHSVAPLYRWGLGGPAGSGLQPFPWIHLDDHVAAMAFLLDHPNLSGPFNLVAPHMVTAYEFSKALGHALHRPAWLPAPAPVLRLALGQMAEELLLNGQNAVPTRLNLEGFVFKKPILSEALAACFAPQAKR